MCRCTWSKGGLAAAAAWVLAAGALAAAAEQSGTSAVRIGLVKTLFQGVPETLIPIGLRPMKALMESQTGLNGELIPSGDADSLARQLKDDEVQLGLFHGVEFAWVHQTYPTLKPLVIAVNGRSCLHVLLVVRTDCKMAVAADLKGKTVALPRMSREHCRLFLERRCCPAGEAPETFFARVDGQSTIEDSLDDVVDDAAQGVVVDDAAFEAYQKNKPGRAAKLKALQKSEAFPCAVIAYQPGGLSEGALRAFRDGLIGAKNSPDARPLLKANHITGFEAVPTDYEQQLLDISKAYPAPITK